LAEHGGEQGEEPIGDPSQGATMAVAASFELRVVSAGAGVQAHRIEGPLVDGAAEGVVARESLHHVDALSALPGHPRGSAVRAQRTVVSVAQRLGRFRQQLAGGDGPDAWQGTKDVCVARAAFWSRFLLVEQALDSAFAVARLGIEQTQLLHQVADVTTGRLGHTVGHEERDAVENFVNLLGRPTLDPMPRKNGLSFATLRARAFAGVGASSSSAQSQAS
jgi:hypothetical protein